LNVILFDWGGEDHNTENAGEIGLKDRRELADQSEKYVITLFSEIYNKHHRIQEQHKLNKNREYFKGIFNPFYYVNLVRLTTSTKYKHIALVSSAGFLT